MKLGKKIVSSIKHLFKELARFVSRSRITQAAVVGLVIALPFIIFVSVTHSIIAPLNILHGWDTSSTNGSVLAKIPSDVNQQMLPFRQYIKDSITKGELPVWNTKSFAGDTFLANPINVALSPFNILLLFVDIYTYQNIIVIIGIFLTASCMYLLLRQLRVSAGGGVLGAVAYSLAPFSVFWSLYGVIAIPMAAIPLVLYFYYRYRESRERFDYNLILMAIILGLVFIVGHIQIAILSYVVLALAVLFDILFNKFRGQRILIIIGAAIVGLLIGFAQLGPLIYQSPASHRSADVTAEPSAKWSDRWAEITRIPTPYPLSDGPVTIGMSTRRDLQIGQFPGILFIIGFVIAIIAFIKKRRLTIIHFFFLLFIFGAFWKWNDFPQTLLNILSPTLKSLASDYFLPIGLVAMSVLAAFGSDFVTTLFFRKNRQRSKNLYPLVVLAIPLLATIAIAIPQLDLAAVGKLNLNYYQAYYLCICFALIFYILVRHEKFAKQLFILTIITISLLQGWALFRVSQPIVSDSILSSGNPQLKYIESQQEKDPTIVDYIGPQESTLYDVSLLNGYDSLYSSSLLPRIQAINYPNTTPRVYRDNALVINTLSKPTLFQNLGVKYTINQAPKSNYDEVLPGVYRSNVPTPPIYFATSIRSESTAAQLETIKSGNVSYHEVPIAGKHIIADNYSTVTYTRTANTLTLKTHSATGGLVFIAQTFNKDWVAQLEDNESIQIQSAYYDFQAIDIPSGNHTIKLRYQPTIVTIGLLVSGITVTLVIILLLYSLKLRLKDDGKKRL